LPAIAAPLFLLTAGGDRLIRMSTGAVPERPSETVCDHRITVRDAPERLSAMRRNLQF
jgi:hypothetical protein